MRVLYVISTLEGGGAESQLCSYAIEQKKLYPDVCFEICAIKKGGVFEKKLKENGIKYSVLNSSGILKSVIKLRKIIKNGKFDIVHAHMFLSDVVARFATVMTKAKVVATHHGLGKWKKKHLIILDKLTKFRVDSFVMVSEQSMELRIKREKYPREKTQVIYNGIADSFLSESPKKLPAAGEKIIVGTTARMTDNKQINLMIDVMKDLENIPQLHYEIIGHGENYEKLVEQTKTLGLEDRVHFLGWQDDVLSHIRNWHIFALPSINEDLPVSMLECMAQGVVPVASRVGGIITLLDNNKNGILCDSSDRKTFTDAVEQLVTHPELYENLSKNARQLVSDTFLISNSVNKTISLYNKLLNGQNI